MLVHIPYTVQIFEHLPYVRKIVTNKIEIVLACKPK